MPARAPRVLVTRAAHQGSALAEALRERGAEPVLLPTIEIAEPTTYAPLDAAFEALATYDWLLFTSANAVQGCLRRGLLAESGQRPKVAAIGQATARALEAAGMLVDLVPPKAVAESLTGALLPYVIRPDGKAAQFLLVRAEQSREYLPETLRAAGAAVTVGAAYRTVLPPDSVARLRQLLDRPSHRMDAVTFASSSSVDHLAALLTAAERTLPQGTVFASIGPVTTATLRGAGWPPHVEAPEATVAALAEALMEFLRR